MAKVTQKTLRRAEAAVAYAEASKDVRAAKAEYDTATDPVRRAKAYQRWVTARAARQEAGRILKPRRRSE